ncbi:MAG: hypothetical protein CMP59_00045 [Flavobacteriales bacterium]|nr:hypothetical protein [Flavobacteriales bacterium]|tara:strand:+ start:3024 stop:3881 length:858 start_codon:yes stop_codon:yes gene_type:complete
MKNGLIDLREVKIIKITLMLISLLHITPMLAQQAECEVDNSSFQFGERIDYNIYYHLAGLWVKAGEVYFKVDSAHIGNNDYYHFDSYGRTYSKYDWVYKVRDQYQTYTRVSDFRPLRFKRKVNEGSTHIREDYLFDHRKKQVQTLRQMHEDSAYVKDTVPYEGCGYDVLSMIYFARNLDYSNMKVDEKIPIKMFIDNAMHESYIRYLGKEELKVKDLGKFKVIKFSPLLIEGTIFNAGEDMTVYVTDDENRIPILIETPILVGSIRARVNGMKGLRHALESLIEK